MGCKALVGALITHPRERAQVVSEHVGRYSRSLPLSGSSRGAPGAHLGLLSTMAQANHMAKPSWSGAPCHARGQARYRSSVQTVGVQVPRKGEYFISIVWEDFAPRYIHKASARHVFANLIRGREEHIFSDQMTKPTKSLESPHRTGCLSLKTGFSLST